MTPDLQLALFAAPDPADPGEAVFVQPLPHALPATGVERDAVVHGVRVSCLLRRSSRARSVRLFVDRSSRVTVVVPRRVPLREVPDVLAEHAPWLARTVERQRRRSIGPRISVKDGARLAVLGDEHVLRVSHEDRLDAGAHVVRADGVIHVRLPPLHPGTPAELLRAWLRRLAAREIPARVTAAGAQLGFVTGRVTVRDQRTKWGACSARGRLSFNWRLVLAPLAVLDYVIVHELCHLRELNHSPRFWELVRRWRPGYERPRAWLREQGDSLDL